MTPFGPCRCTTPTIICSRVNVADLVNSAASPYAGAVTAALFLKHFIDEVPWVHFDVMAFNIRKRPGRP